MFMKRGEFENFITKVQKKKRKKEREKLVFSIYLRHKKLGNNTYCPGTKKSKNFVSVI